MTTSPVSQTLTGMWIASCPLCPWLGGTTTRPAAERMQQAHLDQHRRIQP